MEDYELGRRLGQIFRPPWWWGLVVGAVILSATAWWWPPPREVVEYRQRESEYYTAWWVYYEHKVGNFFYIVANDMTGNPGSIAFQYKDLDQLAAQAETTPAQPEGYSGFQQRWLLISFSLFGFWILIIYLAPQSVLSTVKNFFEERERTWDAFTRSRTKPRGSRQSRERDTGNTGK